MLHIVLRGLGVLTVFALPALTLLACVQPPALVIDTPRGVVPLEPWRASLSAPSGDIRGTATLAPVTYRETEATLTLAGAIPRTTHAWYVQVGECGYDRGILAGPMAYAPIKVDGQGDGTATVVLPFTVPTTGQYFVSVHGSESESSPVIACGNLTKGRLVSGPTIAEATTP